MNITATELLESTCYPSGPSLEYMPEIINDPELIIVAWATQQKTINWKDALCAFCKGNEEGLIVGWTSWVELVLMFDC